jgi:hypothetical protein
MDDFGFMGKKSNVVRLKIESEKPVCRSEC